MTIVCIGGQHFHYAFVTANGTQYWPLFTAILNTAAVNFPSYSVKTLHNSSA